MKSVFIMASGEQSRWEKSYAAQFKQLLPVEGETIIERIQRQVMDRSYKSTVMAHERAILKDVRHYVCTVPESKRRWLCEAVKTLADMWRGQVIILLGDVVYSKAIMDSIFNYEGQVRFWGNLYEIFAMSFNDYEKMIEACDKATEHAENGGPGKLRKVYQAYTGFGFDNNEIHHRVFEEVMITDYTQDIDTVGEWLNFVKEKLNMRIIDDLPQKVKA